MAVTWYGPARYAELTRIDGPISMTAVVGVIRSPLTAIGLGASGPQLLDDRAQVTGPDQQVLGVALGIGGLERVLDLEHDPGAGQRDQARRDPRGLELVVEPFDQGRRSLARPAPRPGSSSAGRAATP